MQVGIPSSQWSSGDSAAANPAPPDENAVSPAPSIAMYLAGLVVTYAGLQAANISLADPSFGALIFGLTFIGFLASFISRRQNIAPRNVELPALVVCICVIIMAVVVDPADSFLAPATVSEDRSNALALLLTWLTVFRSFTLTSDAALLFSCVPTIALIGLVGTSTADPALSTIFLVFIAAAVFMMVHENARQTIFAHADRPEPIAATARATGWAGQIQASAVCTVLAVITANFLTPFFQATGSFLRVNSGLTTIRISQERGAPSRRINDQRTDIQVGTGPVSLTDELILTVKANEPAYWRSATFDKYNGRGWVNLLASTDETLPQIPNGGPADPARPDLRTFEISPSTFSPVPKKAHELEQRFQFVQGTHSELFGAGEPRKVVIHGRGVFRDRAGALRLVDPVTNWDYTVFSHVPEMTAEARSAPPGGYERDIADRYTDLVGMKSDALDRIRAKARELTADIPSASRKVNALLQWVGAQCKYNTAAKGFPSDRDVADYFLFEAREGYCDSFATSLAVLCRSIGIPARVASGFLSGDLDTNESVYLVRDKHRHLWTEVYFNGVGWMTFDATSAADDISPIAETQQRKKGSLLAALLKYGWWPPILLGVVFALLLYVFKVEVIDRFWRPRRKLDGLDLPETNAAIVLAYERACHGLGRRGLSRRPNETAAEYFDRAESALGLCPGAPGLLQDLTELVTRYRYSRATAAASDVERAEQCVSALAQALKGAPRRGLAVMTPAPESA